MGNVVCCCDCKHLRTHEHALDDTALISLQDIWEQPTPGALWKGTEKTEASIWVGTFNVGNECPPEDLSAWIPLGYDVYFIGAQECQYKAPDGHKSHSEHWYSCIQRCIPDHTPVCKREMWMNHAVIYVSSRVKPHVHSIESSVEETGIAHVMANKGGIAMSIFIGDTSLCFVSAHLAANQDKVVRRNSDYAEIIDGVRLGKMKKPLTTQFTHVIWVGDLNYRIDLDKSKVQSLVDQNDWETLLEHDQLHKARQAEEAFYLFEEGPVQFPPTYRHKKGEGVDDAGRRPYDTSDRVPAWCDRILWRSFPDMKLDLSPGSYKSAPTITTSDHCPVSAVFTLDIPKPGRVESSMPSRLRVEVTDLHAEGLQNVDIVGQSAPYVQFSAYWSNEEIRTPYKESTLKPSWVGETFTLPAKAGLNDAQWLQTRHLLFSISAKETFSADEQMGYGVISLRDCIDETRSFTMDVSRLGLPCGKLHGKVQIINAA